MFRYLARATALRYASSTLGKVLHELQQQEADEAATEEAVLRSGSGAALSPRRKTDSSRHLLSISSTSGDASDALGAGSQLELVVVVQQLYDAVLASSVAAPDTVRTPVVHALRCVEDKHPDHAVRAAAALLLGEFFQRALEQPVAYGLVPSTPSTALGQTLGSAGAVLAALGAGHVFGESEGALVQLNDVSSAKQKQLEDFFEALADKEHSAQRLEDGDAAHTPDNVMSDALCVIVNTPGAYESSS